jgi:hypothetical protein
MSGANTMRYRVDSIVMAKISHISSGLDLTPDSTPASRGDNTRAIRLAICTRIGATIAATRITKKISRKSITIR